MEEGKLQQPNFQQTVLLIRSANSNNRHSREGGNPVARIARRCWLGTGFRVKPGMTWLMLFVCQSCKYAFNDHWKGSLGGNLFRVEENTFYGRLRDNSNLHMEIKYSF